MIEDFDAFIDGQPQPLPHLFLVEAVAHVPAGLDRELLSLGALGVGELRVIVAQSEAAEGDVARFVLHDIGVDRRGERVFRLIADALKRREREPLDQDLHRQIGHVPAAVAEAAFEQRFEAVRDRVGELELVVQQTRIGFDVARLVHDLRRGVEFRIEIRDRLHDLSGRDQRALLSMHKLRYLRGLLVVAQAAALLLGHALPDMRAKDRHDAVVELHRVLGVEIQRPVDAVGGVPLLLLALGIELQQPGAVLVIFPGEGDVGVAVELPLGLLDRQGVAVTRRHQGLRPALEASLTIMLAHSGDQRPVS